MPAAKYADVPTVAERKRQIADFIRESGQTDELWKIKCNAAIVASIEKGHITYTGGRLTLTTRGAEQLTEAIIP